MTTETITVRVPKEELENIKHDVLFTIELIQRLKKAGIPVIGILTFRGISHGRMTWYVEEDLDDETHVFEWTGEVEDEEL